MNSAKTITLEELMEYIDKYTNYFITSGGGVTISGGEPLLQPSFLVSLFKKLKQKNIHTAIDTSRNGRYNKANRRINIFN